MAFIIDKDLLADEGATPGTNQNAVGITGPSSASAAALHALSIGQGTKFRMYDDDDELYYRGRWIEDPDDDDNWENPDFQPLDCYGTPNAGCTRIDYRQPDGTWSTL
ncbi:MAG: hypothetical protein ACOH1J_08155 [Microbacteriaceae bacterium]